MKQTNILNDLYKYNTTVARLGEASNYYIWSGSSVADHFIYNHAV